MLCGTGQRRQAGHCGNPSPNDHLVLNPGQPCPYSQPWVVQLGKHMHSKHIPPSSKLRLTQPAPQEDPRMVGAPLSTIPPDIVIMYYCRHADIVIMHQYHHYHDALSSISM